MRSLPLLTLGLLLLAGAIPGRGAQTPLSRGAAIESSLRYCFRAFDGPPIPTDGQPLKFGATTPAELAKAPPFNSAKPLYAIATLGGGEKNRFLFALDASRRSGDAAGGGACYDRLYVDANQNGDLADEPPVRAAHIQGRTIYGPLSLVIPVGGQKRLAHLAVETGEDQHSAQYTLKNLGYYTGTARFGEQAYEVALVDANGNGLFGDPCRVSGSGEAEGDILLVDLNRNHRYDEADVLLKERLTCARRVAVGGQFFELAVPPDGSGFKVTPSTARLAALRSDYPEFGMILANDESYLPIEGRNGQALVPEGRYRVLQWFIRCRDGALSGRRATWKVEGGPQPKESPDLVVSAERTASFKLSAPLVARVKPHQTESGEIDFNLELATASGEEIQDLSVNGKRPSAPTLILLDADGKQLALLKFHYG
jgi:hypothetical protein